tara:strand:- start:2133 stop:4466 length:2334 start_codon:yes stop_codon:yes gene_type:complete
MKNFHNNWKAFLTESAQPEPLTEEELALIAEGRIDDAKKKYPQVDRFIGYLAEEDPSKNNKYLMWSTKQLNARLERAVKQQPERVETYKDDPQFREEGMQGIFYSEMFNYQMEISEVIREFHKNSQRLKNKDINSYKTLDDVIRVNKELGFSQRKKRKGEKAKALEDTEVIFENDYFYIARPYTVEAAAELGSARSKTSWCIARGKCGDEWFTKYTDKGQAFYYVISKYLPEKNDASLQALTISTQGGYDEPDIIAINNRPNKEIEESDFYSNMREVVLAGIIPNPEDFEDEWNDLNTNEPTSELIKKVSAELIEEFGDELEEDIENLDDAEEVYYVIDRVLDGIAELVQRVSRDHGGDNPAGPDENAMQEALNEFEANHNHMSVSLMDPRDYGGESWGWEAYMEFQIPDYLDWVDTGDGAPSVDDYEDELPDIFKEACDAQGVYTDDAEYDSYDESIRARFTPDYDEIDGLAGFKVFLERVSGYDESHDEIKTSAIEMLGEKGFIKSVQRDARLQVFEELPEYQNFNKKLEKGVIKIYSEPFELPLPGLLKALNYDKLKDDRENHQISAAEPSVTQRSFIDRYTNRLAQHIRSGFTEFAENWIAQMASVFDKSSKMASKQLQLPLNEADGFDWPADYYYPVPTMLNIKIEVSPQEQITGTILFELPFKEDADKLEKKLYFIGWMDKHMKEGYELLIQRTLKSAKEFGVYAIEGEPQLFRDEPEEDPELAQVFSGAQEDPDGWTPGAPTPRRNPEGLDENKKTNHKILFENWRKFIK